MATKLAAGRRASWILAMPLVVGLVAFAARDARGQGLPPMESWTKAGDAEGKVPEYDVFSVKENKSGDHMIRMAMKPDGFAFTNITLRSLIANAYGVREDLISGEPGWVSSRHFDFEAKVAGADVDQYKKLSAAQRRSMLQSLLADRFKLKAHTETRQLPVYELVVAKGGVKMKQAAAPPAPPEGAKRPEGMMAGRIMLQPGHIQGDSFNMSGLASQLGSMLRQTVIDKTGDTGRYAVDLRWTPEDAPPASDSAGDAPPSIFTAVQEQLGLRLQATKGPVETVVVDSVEPPPEN